MSDFERLESAGTDRVILTRGSDIKPVPIDWLWHYWLARGKLHILAGAPGAGKTTIALALAATITQGGRWPDGTRCNVGNVLIWSGEDDPADTLVPRLMSMDANMDRVHFVTSAEVDGVTLPFNPARDMLTLSIEAERVGDVRLLIVDPIVSAVSGDSHKNAEVRQSLQPLVDLGTQLDAAVIGITHLSKGTAGRDPTERVTGSIAFSAVARIVLLAAKVKGEDGEDKRVVVRAKANIAPDDGGFEYHVEQVERLKGIPTSIVTWGRSIAGTARELLAEAEEEPAEERSATSEAVESLLRIIGRDMVPMREVVQKMKAEGYSDKATRTARERIGVIVKRSGFGKEMCSYWKLPASAVVPTDAEEEAPAVQDEQPGPAPAASNADTSTSAPKKSRRRAPAKLAATAEGQAVDEEAF